MKNKLKELEESWMLTYIVVSKSSTQENTQLENTRPWWHTWILVLNNSYSSMTDCLRNRVNAYKRHEHQNGWWREKLLRFRKTSQKGTTLSSYKPITCLPITKKILNTRIREEIYYSLEFHGLIQKRCPKETKGTDDPQKSFKVKM